MGPFGIAGMAVGGQMAGGLLSTAANLYGQKRSQDFTEKMMQNKYQWQTADLKAAGLNPALAYMNPAQMGNSASASGGNFGDLGASRTTAMQLQANTAKKAAAEAALAESNTALQTRVNSEIAKNPNNLAAFIRSRILGTGGTASLFNILSHGAETATKANTRKEKTYTPPKRLKELKSYEKEYIRRHN